MDPKLKEFLEDCVTEYICKREQFLKSLNPDTPMAIHTRETIDHAYRMSDELERMQ